MSLPTPRPGLVIRYRFLWSHEADAGADEGSKDRPCAIVVATRRGDDGQIVVIVAPITHAPPDDLEDSIAVPSDVCDRLGLDNAPHWLRLDELNRFVWPGYDLRPIPGSSPTAYNYGMLPPGLFEQLRQGVLDRQRAKAGRVQGRD